MALHQYQRLKQRGILTISSHATTPFGEGLTLCTGHTA